jgi:hypothetical protein
VFLVILLVMLALGLGVWLLTKRSAGGGEAKAKAAATPTYRGQVNPISTTSATSAAPPGGGEAALPAGWVVHADPATGREYFYNESTGESSWTHPGERV